MIFTGIFCAELGAQTAFRKTDNFKIIQDEINRLVLEKRQTPVIIIDEANYIGNAVLNDLKMLFNFEMDSKDRAVLLSGLPQLNSTLRLSIHEPFRQRIVMNYNLEGMTKAEEAFLCCCQTEWRRMHKRYSKTMHWKQSSMQRMELHV